MTAWLEENFFVFVFLATPVLHSFSTALSLKTTNLPGRRLFQLHFDLQLAQGFPFPTGTFDLAASETHPPTPFFTPFFFFSIPASFQTLGHHRRPFFKRLGCVSSLLTFPFSVIISWNAPVGGSDYLLKPLRLLLPQTWRRAAPRRLFL